MIYSPNNEPLVLTEAAADEIKHYAVNRISSLISGYDKLEVMMYIDNHSYSVDFFVTINGKKKQCLDLVDDGVITNKAYEKIAKEIAHYVRKSKYFDPKKVNRYEFVIKNDNVQESLVLTENDADAFLESVGVELFEDEIGINGTLYEGSYGEEILAENGIFLYEDGIVLEGKQKDEYLARKAKEKQDKDKAEASRRRDRYDFDGKSYSRFTGVQKRYKKEDNGEFTQYKGKGNRSDYGYLDDEEDDRNRVKKTRDIYHKELRRRESKADMAYGNHMYGAALLPSKYDKKTTRKEYKNAVKNYNNLAKDGPEARDALNRHMRRHPKQYKESTIFSDIEII